MDNRRWISEAVDACWLALTGGGSAAVAITLPYAGLYLFATSLAFALTVTTMAYVIVPRSRVAPEPCRGTHRPAASATWSTPR